MLKSLLESGRQRKRPVMQAIVSAGLHLMVVAIAVQVTASAYTGPVPSPAAPPLVYVPPDHPRESAASDPGPSEAVIAEAPVTGVVPLPKVLEISTSIDPADLDEVPFDPGTWSKAGPGAENPGGRPGDGPSSAAPGAFLLEQVDEPVVPVYQPAPRYPPALQQMGVSGRVVVLFVVDTLGTVEPGSWRVLSSTHPAFEAAAEEAILKSRFQPARIRGRPVRQLVQQPLSFHVR
jgi:protein TonB